MKQLMVFKQADVPAPSGMIALIYIKTRAENNTVSQCVLEMHFEQELRAFVFSPWGNLICSTGSANEWRYCVLPVFLTEKICTHLAALGHCPIFSSTHVKKNL